MRRLRPAFSALTSRERHPITIEERVFHTPTASAATRCSPCVLIAGNPAESRCEFKLLPSSTRKPGCDFSRLGLLPWHDSGRDPFHFEKRGEAGSLCASAGSLTYSPTVSAMACLQVSPTCSALSSRQARIRPSPASTPLQSD